MSVYDDLVKARIKIKNRSNWASKVSELHPGTDCLSTAIGRSYEAHILFAEANGLPTIGYLPVIDFNDTHTHEECLAALDKAITFAGGET